MNETTTTDISVRKAATKSRTTARNATPASTQGVTNDGTTGALPVADTAGILPGVTATYVPQLTHVPLASICGSTYNPRKAFDERELTDLADSLRRHGMMQPITVRPVRVEGTSHLFQVMAGERRWRAARIAGMTTVPVVVRHDVDDRQALELAVVENLQRSDLNAIERAEGFAALVESGMLQQEVAAAVKRSQGEIAKSLALLQLPDVVQDHVRRGHLPQAHAAALLKYREFPKAAIMIAQFAIKNSLSSKQLDARLWAERDLQSAGLATELTYGTRFDRKICDTCPFGAFKKTEGYGFGWCLKPDHYDLLTRAAEAEQRDRQRAIAAQGEAASAAAGLPAMASIPACQDLDTPWANVPSTCTELCPCRGKAVDNSGQVHRICLKRDRFNELQGDAHREAERARKVMAAAKTEAVMSHLEHLRDCGPAEIALLVSTHLHNQINTPVGKAVLKRFAAGVMATHKGKVPADRTAQLDALRTMTPLEQVQLGVAMSLAHSIEMQSQYSSAPEAARYAWYAEYAKLKLTLSDPSASPPEPAGRPLVDIIAEGDEEEDTPEDEEAEGHIRQGWSRAATANSDPSHMETAEDFDDE